MNRFYNYVSYHRGLNLIKIFSYLSYVLGLRFISMSLILTSWIVSVIFGHNCCVRRSFFENFLCFLNVEKNKNTSQLFLSFFFLPSQEQ